MVLLTFRPVKQRPEHWGSAAAERPTSPFGASHRDTLNLLDRELRQLDAREVFLQVEARSDQIRVDGQLRGDARVDHPGVILTIETRRLGTLVYETDRYGRRWSRDAQAAWKENLRAIALGLEALRRVERYGIARRGQQYAGYRELGSGIPMGATAMSVDDAAAFLVEHGEWGAVAGDPDALIDNPKIAGAYYREAAKRLHPDSGGDPTLFRRLTEARDLLQAAS
jgi:hypothetical protein